MGSFALSTESSLTDPNSISLNGKRKERLGEESGGSCEKKKQKVLQEEQELVESQEKGKRIALEEEQKLKDDRKKGKELMVLDEEQEPVGNQNKGKQKIAEEEEEPPENPEKGKQILLEEEEDVKISPKYWKLYTNYESGGTSGENYLPGSYSENNSEIALKFAPHPITIEKEKEKQKPKRIFKCDFCSKVFTNPYAFGGHQNVHRKERAELNQSTEERRGIDFLELYESLRVPPMFSSLAGRNNLGFSLQSNQPVGLPYCPRPLDMLSFGGGNNAPRMVSSGSALLNPMGFSRTEAGNTSSIIGAANTSSIFGARNGLFSNPQRPSFNGGTMSGLVQNENGPFHPQGSLSFNGGPVSGPGSLENWSNSFLNPHRLGFTGGSFSGAVMEAAGNSPPQFPWSSSLGVGPVANPVILGNRNSTIQNERRAGFHGGILSNAVENNRNRNGEFWGPPLRRGINLNGGGLGNVLGSNVDGSGVEQQRNGLNNGGLGNLLGRNINGYGVEQQRNGGHEAAGMPGLGLGHGHGLGSVGYRRGEAARTRPDEEDEDIDLTLKL